MPMAKSTVSRPKSKPKKPYAGFPMFAHPSGQWSKKIRGKLRYFGVWADPDAALEKLNREWPYLSEGRTPPPVDTGDGCTLRNLANAFLRSKKRKVDAGELSPRSFRDYFQTCEVVLTFFKKDRRVDDLRPDDFEDFRASLAKRLGVSSLKNEINRVRVLLKFAHDQRLIKEPVAYGQSFQRPSAKALRRDKNAAGPKLFSRDELLLILDAADPVMKSMVLLGANCGFGNTDIASLPRSAVNFESGWIDFPRPKTENPRHVPLWPETIAALREAISKRPSPKNEADANLCFLTRQGRPWVRVKPRTKTGETEGEDDEPETAIPIDALSQRFSKLLKRLGINGRRGLGFYTLRHVFETQAGESKDQVAVNAVMGHVDTSMAATYRERISDERLRAVVETVREWLYSPGGER
jgi:integrase